MKKRYSLKPLPGSTEKYVSTLAKFLEFVEGKNPCETRFREWFLPEFPSVKSKRTVKDCITLFENLGLMIRSGDVFTLTDKAREFLEARQKKLLYEALDRGYVAIHEILEILREKPSTLEEIASFIEKENGVKWRTKTQYLTRLGWLLGLGYVTKNGRHYSLTEEGRNIVEGEDEITEEHPTHDEIQDLIVETGKLAKYFTKKEYKTGTHNLDVVWKKIEEGDPAFVFEVLLEGSLSDALARLEYARYRFGRPELYLVTIRKHMSKAKNAIRTSFHEMVNVIHVIHWKDIYTFKESGVEFLKTGRKIGLIPKFTLRRAASIKSPPKATATEKKHQKKLVRTQNHQTSKEKL